MFTCSWVPTAAGEQYGQCWCSRSAGSTPAVTQIIIIALLKH